MRFASFVCLILMADNAMAALGSANIKEPSFWKGHSVVFGEVESVEKLPLEYAKPSHRILFRPKATLSGTFDPGGPKVHVNLNAGPRRSVYGLPDPKQSVILVIQKKDDSYRVSPYLIPFMPGFGRPLFPVSGFDDPYVEKTVAAIQAVRGTVDVNDQSFWKDHSFVTGEIESVEVIPRDQFFQGSHRLVVRPHKTLSGPFDLKRHPKLHVSYWRIPPYRERPQAEQKVMLVIQNHNDSFRVVPNDYSFMPDGAAFVPISSFDDPKVGKTLSAIQELRKHEEKQEN